MDQWPSAPATPPQCPSPALYCELHEGVRQDEHDTREKGTASSRGGLTVRRLAGIPSPARSLQGSYEQRSPSGARYGSIGGRVNGLYLDDNLTHGSCAGYVGTCCSGGAVSSTASVNAIAPLSPRSRAQFPTQSLSPPSTPPWALAPLATPPYTPTPTPPPFADDMTPSPKMQVLLQDEVLEPAGCRELSPLPQTVALSSAWTEQPERTAASAIARAEQHDISEQGSAEALMATTQLTNVRVQSPSEQGSFSWVYSSQPSPWRAAQVQRPELEFSQQDGMFDAGPQAIAANLEEEAARHLHASRQIQEGIDTPQRQRTDRHSAHGDALNTCAEADAREASPAPPLTPSLDLFTAVPACEVDRRLLLGEDENITESSAACATNAESKECSGHAAVIPLAPTLAKTPVRERIATLERRRSGTFSAGCSTLTSGPQSASDNIRLRRRPSIGTNAGDERPVLGEKLEKVVLALDEKATCSEKSRRSVGAVQRVPRLPPSISTCPAETAALIPTPVCSPSNSSYQTVSSPLRCSSKSSCQAERARCDSEQDFDAHGLPLPPAPRTAFEILSAPDELVRELRDQVAQLQEKVRGKEQLEQQLTDLQKQLQDGKASCSSLPPLAVPSAAPAPGVGMPTTNPAVSLAAPDPKAGGADSPPTDSCNDKGTGSKGGKCGPPPLPQGKGHSSESQGKGKSAPPLPGLCAGKAVPPPTSKGGGKSAPPPPKGAGKGAKAGKSKAAGNEEGGGKSSGKGSGREPRKADVQPHTSMKKLFWNSFKLDDGTSTVWDAIEVLGETELGTFDAAELESMFGEQQSGKDHSKRHAQPRARMRVRVFEEPRRRQICIMLARLPGVSATVEAVREMDDVVLNRDQVELLLAISPPSEELQALRSKVAEFERDKVASPKWDDAEDFVLQLSAVPSFSLRLQVWAFENSFEERFQVFESAATDVRDACASISQSPRVRRLLAMALTVGNYLNAGTSRGRADGFTVEAFSQMRNVKAQSTGNCSTPSATLVDHIVRQLEKAQPEELKAVFADGCEAQMAQRASRHNFTDMVTELTAYKTQADILVKQTSLHEANEHDSLSTRGLRLKKLGGDLVALLELYTKTDEEYHKLCTWFNEGTARKSARASHEFFGHWNGFFQAVHEALETLNGGRKRKKGVGETRRPVEHVKRAMNIERDAPINETESQSKAGLRPIAETKE